MQTGATFRLWNVAGLSAAAVTDVLGLQPTSSYEVGHRPTPRSPPRQRCLWLLSSAAPGHGELAEHLGQLLTVLEPVTAALWRLVDQGYEADWFCLAASRATEHAIELDRQLLARLLRLPGRLLIDVMGEDTDD